MPNSGYAITLTDALQYISSRPPRERAHMPHFAARNPARPGRTKAKQRVRTYPCKATHIHAVRDCCTSVCTSCTSASKTRPPDRAKSETVRRARPATATRPRNTRRLRLLHQRLHFVHFAPRNAPSSPREVRDGPPRPARCGNPTTKCAASQLPRQRLHFVHFAPSHLPRTYEGREVLPLPAPVTLQTIPLARRRA